MKTIVDLCLVPIGVGTSLSPYIAACQSILERAGLKHNLHAYGTSIEGDWDAVFKAVRACHEQIHEMGAPRISSSLRVGTRVDRAQSMNDKVDSVRRKVGASEYGPKA